MRWWPFFAMVACDAGGGPLDTDTDTRSGCPDGLVPAATGAVTLTQFTFDGLDWTLGYDGSRSVNGVPAGCVSGDGDTLRLVLFAANEPFAVLSAHFDAAGDAALSEVGSNLAIDVIGGPEPVTFGDASVWRSGTVSVQGVNPLRFDMNGSAVHQGHSLSVRLSATAGP